MSKSGAYFDWEFTTNAKTGPADLISVYVEFAPNLTVAAIQSITAPPNPGEPQVSIHSADQELLKHYINNQSIGSLHGFIEIPDELATAGEDLLNKLPAAAQQWIVRIIYIGSRYNVSPITSEVAIRLPADLANSDVPICAIVDDGIGFLNERFTVEDQEDHFGNKLKSSRFLAVWLQSRENEGLEFSKAEIDQELQKISMGAQESDLYRQIYSDAAFSNRSHRSVDLTLSHGTHLGDIACGAASNASDAMQQVPILGVQMPAQSVADTSGRRLEVNILQAVRWIVYHALLLSSETSKRYPLVINISLGISAGEKNGFGFLETILLQEMNNYQLATATPGNAESGAPIELVLAFGNDRRSRQVAKITFPVANQSRTLHWCLQPDDRAANYLEIRPESAELSFSITPPNAPAVNIPPLQAGDSQDIVSSDGFLIARLYREPNFLSQIGSSPPINRPIYILTTTPTGGYPRFTPAESGKPDLNLAPSGLWGITITSQAPQSASAQVQRGDTPIGYRLHGRQSYIFDSDGYDYDPKTGNWDNPISSLDVHVTRQSTHSSLVSMTNPAIAKAEVWRVGATIMQKDTQEEIFYEALYTGKSSQGAVMTQPRSADRSADGDDSRVMPGVLASGTLSGTVRRLSGTSVSAPQLTRARLERYLNIYDPTTAEREVVGDITIRASLGPKHIRQLERGRRNAKIFLD